MNTLRLTSGMSEIADPFCRVLGSYLADSLGMRVIFEDALPWQARLVRLADGEIHAGWVCGWVYVRGKTQLELLAAPVMAGARYGGRPVYFSDVIVRQDSGLHTFEDLRGTRWVYNEPESFSGYLTMLHRLRQQNETLHFFGETVASGAHTTSFQMVLDGRADVTALDSTAFDQLRQKNPSLEQRVRVVESLGPFPIPPWVVSHTLAEQDRDRLKQVIWEMHNTPRGRAVLSEGLFDRWVPISDAAYDPIRQVIASL